MALKCQFDVGEDNVRSIIRTNGDRIIMKDVHLNPDAAADLARMINMGGTLTVTIKGKGDE